MKDSEAPLVSIDRLKEVVRDLLQVPKETLDRAERGRLKKGRRKPKRTL